RLHPRHAHRLPRSRRSDNHHRPRRSPPLLRAHNRRLPRHPPRPLPPRHQKTPRPSATRTVDVASKIADSSFALCPLPFALCPLPFSLRPLPTPIRLSASPPLRLSASRNRIVSTLAERIAPRHPLDRQPAALEQPVLADRLVAIFGAGRV